MVVAVVCAGMSTGQMPWAAFSSLPSDRRGRSLALRRQTNLSTEPVWQLFYACFDWKGDREGFMLKGGIVNFGKSQAPQDRRDRNAQAMLRRVFEQEHR